MKELYLKLLNLSLNILKIDKLKYFILKNEEFKLKYLNLINDILTLETNHNQSLDDKVFAKIFAKAFILITKPTTKQRFEVNDEITIEQIENNYKQLVSYIVKEFKVVKSKLVSENEQISEEIINQNAILTDQAISKIESRLSKQEQLKEQKTSENSQKTATIISEEPVLKNQTNVQNQSNQQADFLNSFNPNMFANLNNADLPVLPSQDPRFYPYKGKPKFMPYLKIALCVLAVISTILLASSLLYLSYTTIDISSNTYASIIEQNKSWDQLIKNGDKEILKSWPLGISQITLMFKRAFGLPILIYMIPAILICTYTKKTLSNPREKYRIPLFPIIFFIMFFIGLTINLYEFTSIEKFKASRKVFLMGLTNKNDLDINKFFDELLKEHALKFKLASALVIASLIITILTLILAVVLIIVNPKLDREKIVKATLEHQKAVMAVMQGQKYEMDPSLYEEDEIEIKHPSKLKLFFLKLKNKKKKEDNKESND
ncbi:hypothetical protein V2P57_04795 [Mycoplasma mycoides subsp. mycoides]|uniref:Uncharacterized protein n=1 Tax=Mycoplasma mycoides subsp. mycoides TaxID=2103 RepID=A0AAE2JTM9_MYCMY|nr:hypothetical protein [Mycoplasma mycoides]ADK69660.1 conserved hypothetical protein [Mycoplasma mycoides subsp. mycoides SC str. Gladysdale]AIZ55813.1 hypothetical protein mycmycITA_01000 [Mycoplasma mycoides subsp. mycoides]AME11121.1 hypothetical protein MmmBen_0994 [Mycoplasma mycoides subsp. mycoides]AME12137.1 hypothetical protein MmmBen50_0980 [Mycoplasma mycoides subsp. mycoides]AME14191.1 hypothetical protein MmmBen326_1005 [Mycoplasma mycoides subsp. mycoides]